MYKTREDAQTRLLGTIVAHNGSPFSVHDVTGRGPKSIEAIGYKYPERSTLVTINIDDPGFNMFKTPPLGYCNFFVDNTCIWVSRNSARRGGHQGLTNGNTTMRRYNGDSLQGAVNLASIQLTDGFAEMFRDEYPSLEEAKQALVPGSVIAISRNFAIESDSLGRLTLWYRKNAIGSVESDGRVILSSCWQFLTETVIEEPSLPDVVEVRNNA